MTPQPPLADRAGERRRSNGTEPPEGPQDRSEETPDRSEQASDLIEPTQDRFELVQDL